MCVGSVMVIGSGGEIANNFGSFAEKKMPCLKKKIREGHKPYKMPYQYANSEGSDQLEHMRSLVRDFAVFTHVYTHNTLVSC